MKKIHVLVSKEFITPFLFSLVFLTIFLTLAQLIGISDTLLEISLEFRYFLSITIITIPSSLLFAIPITTLLTVFLSIIRLSKDNEIISLLASGISPLGPLVPVLIFSMIMSISSFLTSFYLYPNSVREVKQLIRNLSEDILSRGLPPKIFITPIPNLTFFISESTNEGRSFTGIFIRDSRNTNSIINIYASKGELKNNPKSGLSLFSLSDGIVLKKDWQKEYMDLIIFEGYEMTITRQIRQFKESRGEMDIKKLWEKSNDESISKSKRNLYLSEFHKRIAIPMGTFLLGIIAMPIAFLLGRTTVTGGVGIGILIFLLYYISMVFFSNLADSGKVNIMMALWTPNIFLSLLCFILMWGLNNNFRFFKIHPFRRYH